MLSHSSEHGLKPVNNHRTSIKPIATLVNTALICGRLHFSRARIQADFTGGRLGQLYGRAKQAGG